MKSKIYRGEVMHRRINPAKHELAYSYYFYAFDLDELEDISKKIWFFSHNRFNLVSLKDKDYQKGTGNIKEYIVSFLEGEGVPDIDRVVLVTAARYLGYVFNPVSFYYCYRKDTLECVVVEVNNTFGDRHIYLLKKPVKTDSKGQRVYTAQKEFHVSPFNNMEGSYTFRLTEAGEDISIGITLEREGQPVLFARLTGKGTPLSTKNLITTVMRYPFSILKTVFRIYKEAFKLYFFRKLKYYPRPQPSHDMTIIVNNNGTEKQ